MTIRRGLLPRSPARHSRIHPPYGKRFGEICPEKSTRVLELLRIPAKSHPFDLNMTAIQFYALEHASNWLYACLHRSAGGSGYFAGFSTIARVRYDDGPR